MDLVCIQAYGTLAPGDAVALPDGAAYSTVHLAEPGSPEAATALAQRARSDSAAPAAPPTQSPGPAPDAQGAAGPDATAGGPVPPLTLAGGAR